MEIYNEKSNYNLLINITEANNNSLVEFNWNFTKSTLVINCTIDYNATAGTLKIKNIDLASQGATQTAYINKSDTNYNRVCIADDESLTSLPSDCSGYTAVDCTGTSGQYTCTDLGSSFKIQGLNHSSIRGYQYTAPAAPTGGGGGGGGSSSKKALCNDRKDNDGDGLIDYPNDQGCSSIADNDETDEICEEYWTCSSWSKCLNNQQTRECVDFYSCGTEEQRPAETKKCVEEETLIEKEQGVQIQEEPTEHPVTTGNAIKKPKDYKLIPLIVMIISTITILIIIYTKKELK